MSTEPAGQRPQTMAESALETLREAIILGELAPGAALRLDGLAQTLDMSISPVREAVRELEALGLAERVPHHGARVVALDAEDLRQLFEVRLALESLAVRGAARRFEPADAEAARGHLDAYAAARRAGDVRLAMRAHTAFHFAVYEAARSHWLIRLIRPAWDSSERFRPALVSRRGDLQDRHEQLDEELLLACVAHDEERAAEVLQQHLALAGEFYARELGDGGVFARPVASDLIG
jgi:DNA-binding GntR family transcriptional regulator